MRPPKRPGSLSWAVLACCLAPAAAAQEPPGAQDPPPAGAAAPEPPRDPARFQRRHASGRYVDPDSRFSLQGYVTGTYSDFQSDFPDQSFEPPGQLLVARTDNGSFQYDWALFLASNLDDRLRFVVETHFVTRPDGGFGPEIVTTEARVAWLPFEDKHAFRLTLGQYWAPFASANDDWLSAVNLFATVPYAARAFPLHYNERGVAVEGEFDLGGGRGLNYVASLGNGVSGMSIEDQHGFDFDSDKTAMARVGFFPAGPSFEVGLSALSGRFRGVLREELPPGDARRYPARFEAVAADARLTRPAAELRAYAIHSTEDLEGAPDLRRWGAMGEGALRVARVPLAREVWLKARWDYFRVEGLAGPAARDTVLSVGVNLRPARRGVLKLEAFFHGEDDARRLRDNGFVAQLSASF